MSSPCISWLAQTMESRNEPGRKKSFNGRSDAPIVGPLISCSRSHYLYAQNQPKYARERVRERGSHAFTQTNTKTPHKRRTRISYIPSTDPSGFLCPTSCCAIGPRAMNGSWREERIPLGGAANVDPSTFGSRCGRCCAGAAGRVPISEDVDGLENAVPKSLQNISE